MALAKRKPVEVINKGWEEAIDEEFIFKQPHLLSFLLQPCWAPGASRVTGTVMLMSEHGRLKAWLHDRDSEEGCFVTAASMGELLMAVESTLAGEGGDWRPDKLAAPRNRSRSS